MAVQETITNALASLLGSIAGVLAALVALAVLWIGADYIASTLDFHLPLRQLMAGRAWNTLTVHGRFACVIVNGYIARLRALRWIETRQPHVRRL